MGFNSGLKWLSSLFDCMALAGRVMILKVNRTAQKTRYPSVIKIIVSFALYGSGRTALRVSFEGRECLV
jgi:hypothetical protein